MTPIHPKDPESLAKGKKAFLTFGLIAVGLGTAAIGLKLIQQGEQLAKWQMIRDEIGVELPSVCRGVLYVSKTPLLWPVLLLAAIGLAVIWFVSCDPTKRRILVCFFMLAAVGLGSFLVVERASRITDIWLAQEMETASELDADSVAWHINRFCDESVHWDQRVREARAVIAIGMKQSAGLIDVSRTDRDQLVGLAIDQTNADRTRFLAAWALMSVDHNNEEACQAIAAGIRAALSSEHDDLLAMASNLTEHPCLKRKPEEAPR